MNIKNKIIVLLRGNGKNRVNRLRNAGYNPQEIQNRVNQLVR